MTIRVAGTVRHVRDVLDADALDYVDQVLDLFDESEGPARVEMVGQFDPMGAWWDRPADPTWIDDETQ